MLQAACDPIAFTTVHFPPWIHSSAADMVMRPCVLPFYEGSQMILFAISVL